MTLYDGYGNPIRLDNDTPAVAEKDYEYYGQTPCIYPFINAKSVKLTAEAATAKISGVTAADMENMGDVTLSNLERVDGEGYTYRVTALGANNNAYRISGTVENLVVGETYRICIKHKSFSDAQRYMQVMVGSTSVKTFSYNYDALHEVYFATFVAAKESATIYIYPFAHNDGTAPAVGDTATIDDFYLNRVFDGNDLLTHEIFHYEEIPVSGSAEIGAFKNMIIEADGECAVSIEYKVSKVITVSGLYPDPGGNVEVPKSHLHGKMLVCFGDSITAASEDMREDYPSIIAQNTGMKVFNAGFGGTRMSERNGYEHWDAMAFYSLADAIASGDWSVVEAGASSGGEGMDTFPDKVEKLKEIDWNQVDYITVAYGANDITTDANDSIIDSEDDPYDVHTFLGAFRHAYETIIAAYPHIRFLILTPIYRYFKENGVFTQDSDDKMFAGDTLHYYAWGDALIELCKEYKLPYLDLYRKLNINKFNRDYYFTNPDTGRVDGTHPAVYGSRLTGDVISAGFLSSY